MQTALALFVGMLILGSHTLSAQGCSDADVFVFVVGARPCLARMC